MFEADLGSFGLKVLLIVIYLAIGVKGLIFCLGLVEGRLESRHDTAFLAG